MLVLQLPGTRRRRVLIDPLTSADVDADRTGMPKYAHSEENVATVEELTLAQEGRHEPTV